ncbi:MAG: hypothetical protein ACYDEN_09155 [Acidimicrobiales bacterium]
MRWRRQRKDRRSERQLSMEAAAYLTGDLAALGRRAPAWVLMSRIAHADLPRIVAAAAGRRSADPVGWQAGVAYLAKEMLVLAPDAEALVRLQRDALIPLELDLLSGPVPAPATTRAFVDLVSGVLHDYR